MYRHVVLAAGLLVALFALAVFGPLLADGMIPAGSDLAKFLSEKWFAIQQLQSGEWPLWNPHLAGGVDVQARMLQAMSYPPAALMAWLPIEQFVTAYEMIHIILAGVFMAMFLRRFNLSIWSICVGAVLFAFSRWFSDRVHSGHMNLIACSAWIPLAFFFADRTSSATGRSWFNNLVGLGAVLGIQGLAGRPDIPYLTGVTSIAYLVVMRRWHYRVNSGDGGDGGDVRRSGWSKAGMALAGLAVVGIVGGLICAAQLLPTAEYARFSNRAGAVLVTDDVMRQHAIPMINLAAFVFPDLFGTPVTHSYFGSGDFRGAYFFLSPLAAVFFLVAGLAFRKEAEPRWRLIGLCTLVFTALVVRELMWAGQWVWKILPAFSWFFRDFFRVTAVLTFWSAALFAWAFERLLVAEGLAPTGRKRAAIAAALVAAVALTLSAVKTPLYERAVKPFGERRIEKLIEQGRGRLVSKQEHLARVERFYADEWIPGIQKTLWLSAAALGLFSLSCAGWRSAARRTAGFALVVIPAVSYFSDFVLPLDLRIYYRPTALTTLFRASTADGLHRVVSAGEIMNERMSPIYPIRNAIDYGPAHIARYKRLADLAAGVEQSVDLFGYELKEPMRVNPDILRLMSVNRFASPVPVDGLGEPKHILTDGYRKSGYLDFQFLWTDDAYVYDISGSMPRFSLRGTWAWMKEERVWARMHDSPSSLAAQPALELELSSVGPPFVNVGTAWIDPPANPAPVSVIARVSRSAAPSADDSVIGQLTVVADQNRYQELTVNSDRLALLIITDTFFRGWRAYVNGVEQPIWRANYAFRGIFVPAGESRIILRYSPPVFRLGVALSILGAGLVLAVAFTAWRKWRNT